MATSTTTLGGAIEKTAEKSDVKLRRKLGTIDLLYLSLGGIIGSGWLYAAYGAASIAGPAAILSWIIGGIIIIFVALNYAELGGMLPRSGAIVRYGQYSHGQLAGYMFGWAYFLSAVSVPAIEALAVIGYASSYYTVLYNANTPSTLSTTGLFFAGLLMVGFFFLNWAGIKVMGKINTGMTWWKLIIPFGTVFALFAAGFHGGNLNTSYHGSNGFMPFGFGPVLQAIAVSGIVFSYLGFRQALDYGGEARNPQRSVPTATILSVVIGMVLYTLLQVAFVTSLNFSKLGLAPGNWAGLQSNAAGNFLNNAITTLHAAPFANLALGAGLVFLTYTLFADAYVSPGGTLNVYLGTSQRTLYGIGTQGFLPKVFIKVNEKTRIPFVALITSLIVGLVFLAPFPSWYKLVGFISSATVFTYIVGGPALRVFRKHAPDLKRPFKLPASIIFSPLAFIGASLIVYWSGWPLDGYLGIAIFAGLLLFAVLKLAHAIPNTFNAKSIKAGWWVPVYTIVLIFISYIGDTGLGGRGFIPFPLDDVVVIIVGLVFYFIAVYSGIKSDEIAEITGSGTQYLSEE